HGQAIPVAPVGPPVARLRKTGKIWSKADCSGDDGLIVGGADYFSIQPDLLFGRTAPLEVEIGAGRGDFIIGRAATYPNRNFLAVELSISLAQLVASRAASVGVTNLRIARVDARPLVNLFLPSGSINAYYIYFPDPWPKTRHAKHRLFTHFFVANLYRTLASGASLHVATDVRDYADSMFSLIREHGFSRSGEPVAGLEATAFARKFMTEGRTLYGAVFIK
ncbi:MAG TPA: hypothetical protein VJ728_05655, partial [Candidatus Binataceae bacterium]|nr:hypothetical protein [Candidatus Binataceae bacterium]